MYTTMTDWFTAIIQVNVC